MPLSALPGRPDGLPRYDAALADRLEAELEQARTSLSALEEDAARERLGRVEAELRAHPHLPQAAFLMAECFSLQARAAGADHGRVAELGARRAALEGPRALAFGEPVPAPISATAIPLDIEGLTAADALEVDGAAAPRATSSPGGSPLRLGLLRGLHHFRVLRAGRPVYAGFHEISGQAPALRLDVPALVPCSRDDLDAVNPLLIAAGGPLPAGLGCERWALVRPQGDGVQVALCDARRCGPFVAWQRRPKPALFSPILVDQSRWPSWASFAIAGAGAVLATSLVLWQSGALDRGQRAARLEYGGLNP